MCECIEYDDGTMLLCEVCAGMFKDYQAANFQGDRPLIERLGANAEEVEELLREAFKRGELYQYYYSFPSRGSALDCDKWLDENWRKDEKPTR